MKLLVLGGYGVFGARLARMLCRDGHEVTVAGRNLATAQKLAEELQCGALKLDRDGDLSALDGFEVVIDAAGPFHAYGIDPYRLARTALEKGLHYLDLSDNAAFCAGITELDAEAKRANLALISGLSTVPALSSAAVTALAGPDRVQLIDCAVLPGNRSARGISVMSSILTQIGRPMQVWRGRDWETIPGWSHPADYRLPGGERRQGWIIDVPDLRLFPKHFNADTVIFRAGLELWIMRYTLAMISALRQRWPFKMHPWLVGLFKRAADLLAPFGTGRGGMSVRVIAGEECRHWRLLAEHGDGPYIPGIAARALLRRATLPPGAQPALGLISLAEAEEAMSDLHVTVERTTEPLRPLFPRALGPDFATLPKAVRDTHHTVAIHRFHGRADVTRGNSLLANLLCRVFGFPPTAAQVPVDVIKTATPHGEIWERRFGPRRFRSHLAEGRDGVTERFGPFTFTLGLGVADGALHFPVTSGRLGPVPVPRLLLPISIAREHVSDDRFHFDVELRAPVTRDLIVHYRGWLAPMSFA